MVNKLQENSSKNNFNSVFARRKPNLYYYTYYIREYKSAYKADHLSQKNYT